MEELVGLLVEKGYHVCFLSSQFALDSVTVRIIDNGSVVAELSGTIDRLYDIVNFAYSLAVEKK